MNTVSNIMKHLAVDRDVPPILQVAVLGKDGKKRQVPPYVVSVIYRYWDNSRRELAFGHLVDYDDLLQEMLVELVQAAQAYDPEINPSFVPYLKTCLYFRLNKLRRYYVHREGKTPTESLESLLEEVAEEGMGHPEKLMADDVAEEAAGLFLVKKFLSELTARQRLIALIKMGEVQQLSYDVSQLQIAKFLHTTQPKISLELREIEKLFLKYARTQEPGWMWFIERFTKNTKRRNK